MRTTGARLGFLTAVLLVASCDAAADLVGDAKVPDTGVEPASLDYDGPTYAARDGRVLLVRNGDGELRVLGRAQGWLPNGRLLVGLGARTVVVNPLNHRQAALGPRPPRVVANQNAGQFAPEPPV